MQVVNLLDIAVRLCVISQPALPTTHSEPEIKQIQSNTNTSPTLHSLLVVASVASFEPQITRIRNNGSSTGISVFYVLHTTMLATYSFALLLWGVLNHKRGESYFFPMQPGVADWLNFVQFTVVWLGQLVLYVLESSIPVYDRKKKWTDRVTDSVNVLDSTSS
jgi:hypothetical protein